MELGSRGQAELSPTSYCRYALQAIEVSESRRKRRKRDTGPDVIGMQIKRRLLELAVEEVPAPERFESWLMQKVLQSEAAGPTRAMAEEILADYENARSIGSFSDWLEAGAPTPRFGDSQDKRRDAKTKTTRQS